MLNLLNRMFDRVLIGLAIVAAGLTVILMVCVDFEVVMRYVLGRPTKWVVDFSEYVVFYITFLAAAWVLFKDEHIKIDVVMSALTQRTQRVLNIVYSLIGAGACAVFCLFSWWATWAAFKKGELIWHSIIVPKWLIWMVMPIASLLLAVQFLRRAWFFANKHEFVKRD